MSSQKNSRMINIIVLAFSITLLVSILLNTILYKELMKYYKLLYAAELDPLGLSYFQDEENQQSSDKPLVVFFGDSRAAQWAAPELEGYSFVNRGIGNQTSYQVLLRFEEHVQPLHPEIIVIQVCINDLKTIPLFIERKQEIIANCEANIKSLVQKSLELNSTVILTTVFPTSGKVPFTRQPVWSNDIYEAIGEVNNFIRSYNAEKTIIFDVDDILASTDGNTKSEYIYDLLHLNNVNNG